MLKVIRVNLNNELNGWVEIKMDSDTILQQLRIFQKLLKIFIFLTLTNSSLVYQQHTKVRGRDIKNSEIFYIICSRDLIY